MERKLIANLISSRKEIKNRVTGLPDIFSPYSVILWALKAVKKLNFSGKADKTAGKDYGKCKKFFI